MTETIEKPAARIKMQPSRDDPLQLCPLVLADDPNYLADDSRACAGNESTTMEDIKLGIRKNG